MPVNQTLSVYLPRELWDAVQAAEADPDRAFRATEFCKQKLTDLLLDMHAQLSSGDLGDTGAAQSLADDASQIEYQISFSDSVTSGQAFLDNIASQGAWPISMTVDPAGRLCFVIAWPKVLTEQT